MDSQLVDWEQGIPAVERAPDAAGIKRRGRFSRVVREPLLQFMLLGAVLFVVAHLIEAHQQSADRTILIDDGVVRRLSKLFEMQMGSQPSPARIDGMVEDYVHDEVMYREAVKMGLDQDDEIIRRRLIQKLEFVDRDLAVVPEPSEEQLKAYYEQHRERFIEPGTVTFSHVYFSADESGAEAAERRASQALAVLQSGSLSRAPQMGDRFPLQYDYSQLRRLDTVQIFGETPIVDALFTWPTNRWSGPIRSGYGWHLVYVGARTEDSLPPFEQVRSRVHDAWLDQARQDSNRGQYEQLRSRYTIVRADASSGRPAAP